MYDDQDGSDNGPKGTYEIYRAEGDALFKQGNYKKAIESYTAVSSRNKTEISLLNPKIE